MFTPEKLNIFVKKVNRIRFIGSLKEERNKYRILYIPENVSFKNAYPFMNIMKQDVRYVVAPRIKLTGGGTIPVDTKSNKEIKKLGLNIYSNRAQVEKTGFTHFIDTTNAIKRIVSLTKRNFIASRSNTLLSSLIKKLTTPYTKDKIERNYKNVLLYTMDLGSPIEPSIRRRVIYPFLFHYIKNNDKIPGIDYILVCLFNSKKPETNPIYFKIYDSEIKGNFFSRIVNIFKSIKLDKSEIEDYTSTLSKDVIEKESSSSNMLNQIYEKSLNKDIKEITKTEKEDIKNKISSAISDFIEEYPEKSNMIMDTLGKPSDTPSELIMKHAVLSAVTAYSATKNKDKVDKLLNMGKKLSSKASKKLTDSDKKIINEFTNLTDKYLNRVVERFSYTNISTDAVASNIEMDKVVSNKIPEQIFYKKQDDFVNELKQDTEKLFKQFESKEFPLKFVKLEMETKRDPREVKDTSYQIMKATLQDENGNDLKVEIAIPQISEDGTFMINGHQKVLVNQLVLKPVYFPKPKICKLTSFFSTITLENRFVRNIYYLRAYLVGLVVPMFTYLAYSFRKSGGPKYVFKKLNLDFKLATEKSEVSKIRRETKNPWQISFFDNSVLFLDQAKMENSSLLKSLYYSLKLINYKRLKITGEEFMDPDFQSTILILGTGKKNAPYRIDSINNGFMDQVTKEILEGDGYPTNLMDLVWWAIEKLQTDYFDRRTDIGVQRIRSTEVFAQGIYKQLLMAYSVYQNRKLSGIEKADFEINPMHVFKQIANSQLVRMKENVNPAEELSMMTRVTFVGIGGLGNKAGAGNAMRSVDPSYFGNISAIDTPEGGCVFLSLPIRTKGGIKKIGDVNVGDILDNNDIIVNKMYTRKAAYIIETKLGEIGCSKDHRWPVYDTKKKEIILLTTEEISLDTNRYKLLRKRE